MTKISRIDAETQRAIGIWDAEAHETVHMKGQPDEQWPNGAGDAAAAIRHV